MKTYGYMLGGSLDPNHPTYVLRKADEELPEILGKSQTCSILTSKQMGKSTVAKRATQELENNDDNIICLTVDLEAINENNNETIWYNSFVYNLIFKNSNLSNIKHSLNEEWKNLKSEELDYSTKLDKFLNKILELTDKKHLIIVIDEIDEFREITFNTDTLLNYIRCSHNHYQSNTSNTSQINRITFCLIGTGRPNDFIKDKYMRSFNVGEKIELRGLEFNYDSIDKLSPGLVEKFKNETLAKLILQEIFNWTNGQPFLTQLLCALICNVTESTESEKDVARFVENCIDKNIQTYPEYREHCDFIENRIKNTQSQTIRLLERYKEILEKGEVPTDPNYNYEDTELRLSGLVIQTNGDHLQPFNPIYKKFFGLDWVNKKLEEEIKVRPYADKFNAWLKAKEELKERYLLYGIELENAQIWQEENPKKLGNDDIAFVKDSEKFCQRVENFPVNSDDQAFIKILCCWTGGIKLFNDLMCTWAKDKRLADPENGQEKIWFETKLVPRLKDNEKVKKHIQEISDRILNDPNIDPFLLLSSYKEILEREEVEFNNSPEHQKLIDMCLAIKEENKLRILNKIYRIIFDKKWVEEQLSSLCPYAKEFQAWQASACQDEYLLKGQYLQKALDWIQNKDKLSESELEFLITSLFWEKWQSDEAVNKVKEFLPQLQEKTNNPAHLVRVIQAILNGTKPQFVLLQEVLKWVDQAEFIPTEDEAKWLEGVVQRHLKNCKAQKLSDYLDYNNPSNAIWQELKNENAFIIIDKFLEKKEPSQEDIDKVKNYKKRLDNTQVSIYTTESENNFQPLILDILHSKFERAYNMAGQKEFDQLLDKIVADAGGDLEAIIIFDLSEGLPLYHNKGLKDRNSKLYSALFGEGYDIGGGAIEGFNTLNRMQEAFNNFGEKTEFKDSTSIIVNFANGKMMIYFHQAPDIPTAICFMASQEINLGSINRRANQVISNIKQKLDEV